MKIEKAQSGWKCWQQVGSPVMDAADFPECGEDTMPLEAHAGRQGGNRGL